MTGKERRKKRNRRNRGNKKRNMISDIILGVAVLTFLFSAYKLIGIYSEYHRSDKEYDNLVKEAIVIQVPEDTAEVQSEGEPKPEPEPVQNVRVHASLKVDFETLKRTNQDIVGWIQFDQPKRINYPLVQGADNDKYLNTTFEGKTNTSGTLFVDANNHREFGDRNTFIYGHNMKNGSMFGQLRKYKNKSYYDQNPYFYIYTPDGKEVKYQIFAVCIVEDTSRSYTRFYSSPEEYLDYLNYIKSIARYDTGVTVTEESQIVSLSTCTNVTETQRMLVHGVKIGESMVGE